VTEAPILITMGDAAGIGPEIVCEAFARGAAEGCMVVGDLGVMRRAAALRRSNLLPVARWDTTDGTAELPPRCVPVIEPAGLPQGLAQLPWGRVDARAGTAAALCIEFAVDSVGSGSAAAIVTAPIHKEALAAAGVPFPGHTEMLQALAARGGAPAPVPVRMMLANPQLRVVLATIHVALKRAIELLDEPLVFETIRIAHAALQRFGIAGPRIAVAGLNPHAGEGGLFGDEEQRVIAPAVAAARAAGIDASGPHAPDTVFMRARNTGSHRGEFDVVVAMTHDHGLIPIKYLGIEQGVNVTLGLPFVRTSPDHGTAFDIAGRGLADPASLIAAIEMARGLSAGMAADRRVS
jgi:4-hydroxythreonine-4-phosphate dehydrogenase